MNEPVKRKRHIGLWITFIILFLVVILPVGLVFAFFFDPTHTTSEELGVKTTGEQKPFTENLVVDLFDYTDDASKKNSLSFSITEQDINQTLYDNLLSPMDENTRSFIPQAYLDVGEEYTFVVEMNAYGFFKSRLFLITTLSQSENPKGLMFELKSLKIGRLGGLQSIVIGAINNSITDSDIETELSKSLPISVESHIITPSNGKRYLFYPHDNFVADINKMVDLGSDMAFFKDFVIDMVSENKFSFDFYKDKGIQGLMSLQEFHDNSTYGSYNDYVIDFAQKTEINKYLPTLLKNGNANENNIDMLTKFISYGYSQLSLAEKAMINSASYLPGVLGKSASSYSEEREAKFATKGSALDKVEQIDEIVSNQVSKALTPSKISEIVLNNGGHVVDAVVNEVQLHDVLKTSSVIGYGKTLYRQTDDGGYKVAFVSIDNMYINIVGDKLYFVLGININGYEVSMILSSRIQTGSAGSIYFKLDGDNAYFGNYKIPATLFNSFSSMLGSVMESSGWFSYDKTNNRFAINFSEAINTNPQILILKASGLSIDIGISVVGDKTSDNGYISVSVDASRV